MRIAVSACLLGEQCKYNGGSNCNDELIEALRVWGHEVIPVCPEVAGGLPIPRPRAEFRAGAKVEFRRIEEAGGVDLAVLQPRSPSCGVDTVYDGTFTGKLVPGDGVFVQLLRKREIPAVAADKLQLADLGSEDECEGVDRIA